VQGRCTYNCYRVVGVISQVDLFLPSSLLHNGHVTVQREADGVEEVWVHDFMASFARTCWDSPFKTVAKDHTKNL
jgi:hypothetical protein